ncbi:ABC transporter permease [Candidatus Poribacteria bacterium]|nr:ABC transporter permease [Candidatus Poribacteria bacterium]MYG06773.1 ABC transporter permease [Candidatus Poribacteria bacterium]MYK24583.1 ABC transporter permease [Candidatus Poribacteria bacterium]
MKFYDVLTSGVVNIYQSKLRASLSILGILIGITSVLCMIAIGEGAEKIIADDLERLGGANHVRFSTRTATYRYGRRHATTERYTLADASAIEAECADVTGALPRNWRSRILVTSHKGGETRHATLEGTTADYALLMHWKLRDGRFLSENDIDNATQTCVLGTNVAIELFGDTSPLGQEVKIRYHWRQIPIRMRVVGVMSPKGRNFSITWGNLDDAICIPLTTYQQRITGIRYVERLNILAHV